jgi:Ser/Thr protein kinase RdoA (MazF antagonist)
MRLWENPQPLVNAEAFCRGYAQKQRLTAAEIAAIPWLMRLRNAASAVWWFGRQWAGRDNRFGCTHWRSAAVRCLVEQ